MSDVISGFVLGTETWDQGHQKRGQVKKGTRTVAFTVLVISILIVFYLLFVSTRLWVVNLGYRTSQAVAEQKELLENNKRLRIEQELLISPEMIDSYARTELGMKEPQENQIRFVP
jgi:cell division protein FtsL